MKIISTFNPARVVDSFRLEEILKIYKDPRQGLVDIISNTLYDKNVKKWLKFWRSKNVPWAVTKEEKGIINVWKRNEV